MGKQFKIFSFLLLLLLVAGISANAGMTTGNKKTADSVKTADSAIKKVPESSIIDQVIWVVGDEPILKSDVEVMRIQGEMNNTKWSGDPDCSIPEEIAVQKLFLHQAALDSIVVKESDVSAGIDEQISNWIQQIGSREKLEEYRKQTINQMRQQMHDDYKNSLLIREMQRKIVENITATPADVRQYFKNLPQDSLPLIPTEVEVEIITRNPRISPSEINRVKDELREYTDRINKGETTFATLARLYSEDTESARQGGELGYSGRGMLDPTFANVAFNLTDPKKISKIVETEFGYHILQLIDKRGDKVNVRHILRKPQVTQGAIDSTIVLLDSMSNEIRAGKFTFEDAAIPRISDDKETNNNHGLMYNTIADETTGAPVRTSRFKMKELPTEVARVVDTLKVGEVSRAFTMNNDKGKEVCAIIRLRSKRDAHRANITEDFQVMKNIVMSKKRTDTLHDWVVKKIKDTYVRMDDRYKKCDFQYQGWVK